MIFRRYKAIRQLLRKFAPLQTSQAADAVGQLLQAMAIFTGQILQACQGANIVEKLLQSWTRQLCSGNSCTAVRAPML